MIFMRGVESLQPSLEACKASDELSVPNRATHSGLTRQPRSSFARTLCCLSQQANVTRVLDVVLGRGNTAFTVGMCMERAVKKHAWTVAGFEMDEKVVEVTKQNLNALGVNLVSCPGGQCLQPDVEHIRTTKLSAAKQMDVAHVTIINGLVSQSGLNMLCADGAVDLAIIDPISNFAWEVFAVESTCKPRYYLINNINLPNHAGWAKEWLLNLKKNGAFQEIANGKLIDPNAVLNAKKLHKEARMASVYRQRLWSLLVRT